MFAKPMQKNAKECQIHGLPRSVRTQPWFLYVIECEDGSLYTGVAVDAHLRYAQHVTGGGARYTRSHPPRRMLLCLGYADRSAALKAEYALKQLTAAQKRAYVARYAGGG